MSEPSIDLVRRTARLARLDVSPAEAEALGRDFERILEHFRVLAALDVGDALPLTGPAELADVLRPDEPRPGLSPAALLANAPERAGDFFAVPKTVGGEE